MSDTIKVTPEKLKSTASSFQQIGNDIRKTAQEMISVITGISNSVWSSETSKTYISKFKGLDTDVSKMCKMINEQVSHLNMIADQYRTTEDQTRAAAHTLKNNVL